MKREFTASTLGWIFLCFAVGIAGFVLVMDEYVLGTSELGRTNAEYGDATAPIDTTFEGIRLASSEEISELPQNNPCKQVVLLVDSELEFQFEMPEDVLVESIVSEHTGCSRTALNSSTTVFLKSGQSFVVERSNLSNRGLGFEGQNFELSYATIGGLPVALLRSGGINQVLIVEDRNVPRVTHLVGDIPMRQLLFIANSIRR